MNVFISYSVNDTSLVIMIVKHLRLQGHSVRWWHESKEPGKDMWPQIFGWIDAADLVLAVVTDNTVARGLAVGNEIGRARAKGKMIIPLVAQNVVTSDLGCLSEVVQIRFDPRNLWPAIMELQRHTPPPTVPGVGQPATNSGAAVLAVIALVLLAMAASSK